MGFWLWNLVLIQGLPLFVLGAVNHSRTLEIIGFALLVLFARTGWPAVFFGGGSWPIPWSASRSSSRRDERRRR